MSKGILVALFCLWFSVGVQAAVQYPTDKDPFEKLEKTVMKMSKKERAKLLETIYDFMIKREDFQTTPLVVLNKEPLPDWLNNLLWETATAVPPTAAQTSNCLSHGYAWTKCAKEDTNCRPTKYPNSCIMAGNIICTIDVPPKCNKQHLGDLGLVCDNNEIKCNPDLIMECNGDKRSKDVCVDPKKARSVDRSPKITEACIRGYDLGKSIEDRAKEVAACADPKKVADALKNIAKFCSTLASEEVDRKLRDMKDGNGASLFDSSVPRRDGRGHYRANWAGNDKDCLDMLDYLAVIQKNPPRVATPTTPSAPPAPPKPLDRDIACKDFPSLCEGQDTGATCGSYVYAPGKKQKDECVPLNITQEENDDYNESPKICNDLVKDVSQKGRERQLGWLHRTCRSFNWNDRTKIGRGDIKDLTVGDGYVCWDAKEGKFVNPKKFDDFINQTVKIPEQREKIQNMFNECANRSNRELARQGIVLRGRKAEEAASDYARVKTMWAIMRVDDVTNTHMSVKRTTGIGDSANGRTIATCSPEAPCTEGTFVCAQVEKKNDGKMEIKNDRVAEYATIYSNRQPEGGGVGETQYVEVGTYRTPHTVAKVKPNGEVIETYWENDKNDDLGKKWDYLDCPRQFDVFDAGQDFPFLSTSRVTPPQPLKNEWVNGLFKKRQSVVYHATERICPEGAIGAGRRYNKVVARRNATGDIDSGIYVCDSENGREYARWMWTEEPTSEKKENGTSTFKNMTMVNRGTGSADKLNLTFNTDKVGICLWNWADTNQPAQLVPNDHTARVQGSIQNNGRAMPGSRGIQSTEPPIIVEEPKK